MNRNGELPVAARFGALMFVAAFGCGEQPTVGTTDSMTPMSGGPEDLGSGPAAPAHDVTFESLLAEMLQLETIARPDPAPFRARMASSYDRASVSPDEPGWFGNADAAQFLREEEVGDRTEYVILDVTGPGAVTRIWTAKPVGTLRVYLDGSSEPAIEWDFEDFFSDTESAAEAQFSYRVPHGDADNCGHHVPMGAANFYLPIPFAGGMKMTLDDPDTYYQVSYREYAPEVSVRTWQPWDREQSGTLIGRAERTLEGSVLVDEDVTIAADGRTDYVVTATDHPGSALRHLAVDLGHADPETLRAVWVTIAFDGHELVRGPIAEVLGQGGPGLVDGESALFRVRGSQMLSRLVMPFRESLVLSFHSALTVPLEARVAYELAPFEFGAEDWFLHAAWMPPHVADASELSEYRHIAIAGGGRYVGNVLNVRNSSRVWWGEGDEKIWVDDEPFPSFFGTGTEDYYGYAWCSAALFSELYHGQTRVQGPELYGHLSMYRWHVPDSIPFAEALAFDLETRHWREYALVGYEAMHFWYGPPSSRATATGPFSPEVPPIPEHDPELAGDGDIPNDWEP
ncbi:MAG: DUF2961 domain-containing protein [Deltaproteobacteria bacterium]|nr:DUF2961 domain-containing protein [Deltaproteobacteria bacterium]